MSSGFEFSEVGLAVAERTRSTRKDRPDSGVRCHSTAWIARVKESRFDFWMVFWISLRKQSFCGVVSDKGRERLMCKGKGTARSLVRKEVRNIGWVDLKAARREERRSNAAEGGIHSM